MAENDRPVAALRIETIGFSKLDDNKIISQVIEVQPVRRVEDDREISIKQNTCKDVEAMTQNEGVFTKRIETIGFPKLDDNKIVSQVIEVQPVRSDENRIEGDRKISVKQDISKDGMVTQNEDVLTKPECQIKNITAKDADTGHTYPSNSEEIKTEIVTFLNLTEDIRRIDSAVISGPHLQRKCLELKRNSYEVTLPLPKNKESEKVSETDIGNKNLATEENETISSNEHIDNESRNISKHDIPVQKPEIELKEKEAIYNKPVSRLPKRISGNIEQSTPSNSTKSPKTNIATSQIVNEKNKNEWCSRIPSIVPDSPHAIRQEPLFENSPGKDSESLASKEEKNKDQDTKNNNEEFQNIDKNIIDTQVSSNASDSPKKILAQREFDFETEKPVSQEIICTNDTKEKHNVVNLILVQNVVRESNENQPKDNITAITHNTDFHSENIDGILANEFPSDEGSTPIILEEIVNSEIPEEIDEIFEELYDALAGTDEPKAEAKLEDDRKTNDIIISTHSSDNDVMTADLCEPSFDETQMPMKDLEVTSEEFEDPESKSLEIANINPIECINNQNYLELGKTQVTDYNSPLHSNSSETVLGHGVKTDDISPNGTDDNELNNITPVNEEENNKESSIHISHFKDESQPMNDKVSKPNKDMENHNLNHSSDNDLLILGDVENAADILPNKTSDNEIINETPVNIGEDHKESSIRISQFKDESQPMNDKVSKPNKDMENHNLNHSSDNANPENETEHITERSNEAIVILKDNIDQDGTVYTPVLTVTKTEIVRTTPTSKLQKIIVTEKNQGATTSQKPITVETPTNNEIKQEDILSNEKNNIPEPRNRNSTRNKMKEILDRSSDDFNQLDIPKKDYHNKKTERSNETRFHKEFKPKIVDELTKQEAKDKESRIPKRQPVSGLRKLSQSDDSTVKVKYRSKNDITSVGLNGKVDKILKNMDKRPFKQHKNESFYFTDTQNVNVEDFIANEEKPTNDNIDQSKECLLNIDNSNVIKETNAKKGIKGKVQNIIKNIVSINKPSREVDFETVNRTEKVGSVQNVKPIDNEETENNLESVDNPKKSNIKGKVQRVLKRFESQNNDPTVLGDEKMESGIEAANPIDKPTNTKVKYIRKQFEYNKQEPDSPLPQIEVQAISPTRLLDNKDPFLDGNKSQNERYFRPRYFKKEDERAMESSRGKVKNILRKIESKNNPQERKEGLIKGKSMEHLPQITLDIRREFSRRKSVSETIAMFESNRLTPTEFDGRPRRDPANIRDSTTISAPNLSMNGASNEVNGHSRGTVVRDNGNADASVTNGRHITVDTNGNEPRGDEGNTETEEVRAKLEEFARAKEDFGATTVPTLKINKDVDMPAIALGTGLLSSEAIAIVKAAIDLGYRHIDTAPIYGTEPQVGEAIRAKIEDGTVTREELFVTTKLWSVFHRQDLVEAACRDSLKSLGLQYLDLYLIHNPMSMKEDAGLLPIRDNLFEASETSDFMDAWRGMEDLVRKGLVRNIGVSNFNSQQISRVLNEGSIAPAVNQVEIHQYFNQSALGEFCTKRGIALVGYGTLGSVGTPDEYLTRGKLVLEDPLVKSIADKHGRTPAEILIRYQLQRGRGVVVKSSSARRLWSNLQAATFKLTEQEVEALSGLDAGQRHYKMEQMGTNHKNYPFNIPF